MRKSLFVTTLMVFLSTAVITGQVSAFEIGIGAMTWYGAWNAPWSDGTIRMPPGSGALLGFVPPTAISTKGMPPYKSDPAFLAGPVLSLKLHERISISGVGLAGRFVAVSRGNYIAAPFGFIADGCYRKDIVKFDVDTLLNVGINRYLKIFVGFKAQGYDYRENIRFPNVSRGGMVYADDASDTMRNYGPGAGFGLTLHLVDNLYLLSNVAGTVLFGNERYRFHWNTVFVVPFTAGQPVFNLLTQFFDARFVAYGGSASLSLAYLVTRADITITLGGRYQMLYYRQIHDGIKSWNEAFNYNGKFDHFYGVTLAVVYAIKFGGRPAGS